MPTHRHTMYPSSIYDHHEYEHGKSIVVTEIRILFITKKSFYNNNIYFLSIN